MKPKQKRFLMRQIGDLFRDLRFAARSLQKHYAFSLVVLTVLGLSIGANTALFSIVHAVLLRPLPFPAPHELVQVTKEWQPPWLTHKEWTSGLAFREILAWRQGNQAFSQMAAYDAKPIELDHRPGIHAGQRREGLGLVF